MKNRELKFRAWDSELKCFGHGCRNQLTDRTDFILVISDNAIGFKKIDGSKADTALNFNKVSWREIENQDKYEIMQYTGLKDKNGKEIYEGDIVRNPFGTIYSVEYHIGAFKLHNGTEIHYYDLEIIGNIHQNKEILK